MNMIMLISAFLLSCTGGDLENLQSVDTETTTHYVTSAAELHALGELSSEHLIIWRNGDYSDQVVNLKGSATLRAEEEGKVVFHGASYLTITGKKATVEGFWWKDPTPVAGKAVIRFNSNTSECVVQNCAVTGYNLPVQQDVDTKWVSLYGKGNTVRGCSFADKRNMGTTLVVWFEKDVIPSHTIERNYFSRPLTIYNRETGKAVNGQEIIRIGTSDWSMTDGNCTVSGNLFHNCYGELAEIVSNKSCNNTYEGNLFYESKGSLTLRHGNNCVVKGNYFLGNNLEGTGGVRVIGENHIVERNYFEGLAGTNYNSAICLVRGEKDAALNGYWQVKNTKVANNTIVDCKTGITANYGSRTSQTMPVISTEVTSNLIICASTSNYSVNCITTPRPSITWTGNVIFQGKQSGVSLETVAKKPNFQRPNAIIELIDSQAGVHFELN